MPDSSPKPAPAGKTILVVEDEAAILAITSQLIAALGYTALSAHSPAEALTLAEAYQGPIHLILTDVVMPGMNGKALTDAIRAFHPRIKRIYMSGFPSGLVVSPGNHDESVDFLAKPFTRKALEEKLAQLLHD
jgi:CheY-like chemotaxis protein